MNPIDARRASGYGRRLLGLKAAATFPLVLGNELAGVVEAVGKGVSYGGGMRICPGARLDDGLLAVTVLEAVSRRVLLRVFPSVYSGRHVEHPRVQVLQGRSVTLEGAAVAYADGERLGKLPLRCESVPGALRVIAPLLP